MLSGQFPLASWASPFSCASTQPVLSLLSLPGLITLSTIDLETLVNTKQDSVIPKISHSKDKNMLRWTNCLNLHTWLKAASLGTCSSGAQYEGMHTGLDVKAHIPALPLVRLRSQSRWKEDGEKNRLMRESGRVGPIKSWKACWIALWRCQVGSYQLLSVLTGESSGP